MRFLTVIAIGVFAASGVAASDLTDYLPVYNLSLTNSVPRDTRSIVDDNRDYDDFRAQYDYDEDGRLTAVYFAGWNAGWGSVERFKWSADGRLLSSSTEAHGSDVSYDHYNTTYTCAPDGRVKGYKKSHYFSAPPELNRVKLNDIQCTYAYDGNGNCTSVTISDDGKHYDYNVMAVVDGTPTVTQIVYTYDPMQRLIKAVETVNGAERSRQTFEYASGKYGDYLKRSVYRRPRYEGEGPGTGTITSEYIPFGQEVPSGYLKQTTYRGLDSTGSEQTSTQTRIYNGLPISVTEADFGPAQP